MESLKQKILQEGTAIGSAIVKVDGFINHRIDVKFMDEMGCEFKRRFADAKVDKILTIEASGIAIAMAAARYFDYAPVIFAKKAAPNTMVEDCLAAEAKSFTKGTVSLIRVTAKFLQKGDNILILDDFLAHGEAASALCDIVEQAGANVVGIGDAIEKKFQGGAARLREKGYRVESLAVIENIQDGVITFEE